MPSPTYVPVVQNGGALTPAQVNVTGAAAGTDAITTRVTGDVAARLVIDADGTLRWSDGTGAPDVAFGREGPGSLRSAGYFAMDSGQSDGAFSIFSGAAEALNLGTDGGGIAIAEGANARMGVATLVGGTVTVANTSVTATTRIFLTSQADGGAPGFLRVSARVAATSFTITSGSGTDTSTVAYLLVEPAA